MRQVDGPRNSSDVPLSDALPGAWLKPASVPHITAFGAVEAILSLVRFWHLADSVRLNIRYRRRPALAAVDAAMRAELASIVLAPLAASAVQRVG